MKTLEKTGGNKFLAFLKRAVRNQIFIPLAALLILVLFNLIADPSFFAIKYAPNSAGDMVISGDRKSTRLNSSHKHRSRMPSSA